MAYAENTTVPVAKTRGEIEGLVERYGATQFVSGWDGTKAAIEFGVKDRRVRFTLPLPSLDWARAQVKKRKRGWYGKLDPLAQEVAEQENRRRWRCLLLAIKSKLEVVETGIETFEQAFLAQIVTHDGRTVHECVTASNGLLALSAGDATTEARVVDAEVVR